MKRTDIKNLETALIKVLPRYPVVFAYLFGSQAIGKTHQGSDIDVAMSFADASKNEAFDLILEILSKIAAVGGVNTDRLDISNFDSLPLPVRFRVVRDGRLLYCQDLGQLRKKTLKTVSLYHDEEPFFEKAAQAFFERHATQIT